jgi:hypothetical protein
MVRIIKINNLEIDLDRITNPKLRRVVFDRSFMFSYSDHKDRSSPIVHSDHKAGHNEEYTDGYSERSGHIDQTKSPQGHVDVTNVHGDYNAYSEEHTDMGT